MNIQALVTQLVFEHALRIRMKTEAPPASTTSTAATTPENASVADIHDTDRTAADDDGDDDTVASQNHSTSTPSRKGKGTPTSSSVGGVRKPAAVPEQNGTASNFMGKINNLVTSDLANITSGADFMVLCTYFRQ